MPATTPIRMTIEALQARHMTISGVVSAPLTYPASISNADLPMVLVWPGEAIHSPVSLGHRTHTIRQFHVRVFVQPVSLGGGVDQGIANTIDLLERFIDAYDDRAAYELATTPYHIVIALDEQQWFDSGVDGKLYYADHEYHGFWIRLPVSIWNPMPS